MILKCFCVHNERTNTHTHTRIVCVVCFYFPPQNNVSMLLKWIFFALLFNASQRIKLCRLDAMNLYSRSRHKRHHVNIQTHIAFNFHFIFCSSLYYSSSSAASLFFFYSFSAHLITRHFLFVLLLVDMNATRTPIQSRPIHMSISCSVSFSLLLLFIQSKRLMMRIVKCLFATP